MFVEAHPYYSKTKKDSLLWSYIKVKNNSTLPFSLPLSLSIFAFFSLSLHLSFCFAFSFVSSPLILSSPTVKTTIAT
jgi:hypothetical protein